MWPVSAFPFALALPRALHARTTHVRTLASRAAFRAQLRSPSLRVTAADAVSLPLEPLDLPSFLSADASARVLHFAQPTPTARPELIDQTFELHGRRLMRLFVCEDVLLRCTQLPPPLQRTVTHSICLPAALARAVVACGLSQHVRVVRAARTAAAVTSLVEGMQGRGEVAFRTLAPGHQQECLMQCLFALAGAIAHGHGLNVARRLVHKVFLQPLRTILVCEVVEGHYFPTEDTVFRSHMKASDVLRRTCAAHHCVPAYYYYDMPAARLPSLAARTAARTACAEVIPPDTRQLCLNCFHPALQTLQHPAPPGGSVLRVAVHAGEGGACLGVGFAPTMEDAKEAAAVSALKSVFSFYDPHVALPPIPAHIPL